MRSTVIFGCEGPILKEEEKEFFAKIKPFGFILFGRNVESPKQVKQLCDDLRATINDPTAPILIDQEGGRVRRMRPPEWVDNFAMKPFGDLYERDPSLAIEMLQLQCDVQSSQFHVAGINVTCAPVLDTRFAYSHDVVGDRAFSEDTEIISILGEVVIKRFEENGILPIIKHIPGHGRAKIDSHLDLPRIDASLNDLQDIDFKPFKHVLAHTDVSMAMTAHLLYENLDPDHCGTMSSKIIRQVIREDLGFNGILMTDDLSMKALKGSFSEKTIACLDAGCDLILHCSGNMEEMVEVSKSLKIIESGVWEQWCKSRMQLETSFTPFSRFEEETAIEKLRKVLQL